MKLWTLIFPWTRLNEIERRLEKQDSFNENVLHNLQICDRNFTDHNVKLNHLLDHECNKQRYFKLLKDYGRKRRTRQSVESN